MGSGRFCIGSATLMLLALLCWGGPRARANTVCPKRPADRVKAKTLAGQWWKKAVAHYDKGQNLEAIGAWQCAHKLAPHPLALYNIGRSAVLAGKIALAVKSYEEYLRLMPNAANKTEVRATLRGLRKRMPKRPPPERRTPPVRRVTPPERRTPPVRRVIPPERRTPPVRRVIPPESRTPPVRRAVVIPDTPEEPKPVDRGRTLKIAGWSTLSVGVVLAGVAGAFGALTAKATSDVEDAEPGTTWARVQDIQKRAELFNGLTWAFVGVGVAAVVTGTALLVLGYRRGKERRLTVTPAVLPGGAAVTLGGTF